MAGLVPAIHDLFSIVAQPRRCKARHGWPLTKCGHDGGAWGSGQGVSAATVKKARHRRAGHASPDLKGIAPPSGPVMAGRVPAIHDLLSAVAMFLALQIKTWMAATSAAMTAERGVADGASRRRQ